VTKVPDDVRLDLRERARYFAELSDVGVPRSALAAPVSALAAPPVAAAVAKAVRAPAAPVLTPEGAPLGDLEAVRSWIGDCQRCKLAGGRKTIVFGQGSAEARLMFVGRRRARTKTSRAWPSWAAPASSSPTSSRRG
jgi:DNA polymerase